MLLLPVVVGLADLVAAQNPSPSTTTETLAQRCVTNSGPSSRLVLETRTRTPALTTRITSTLDTMPTITVTPSLVTETSVVNVTVTNTETQNGTTNVLKITNAQSVTTMFTVTVTNTTTHLVTETNTNTTSATIAPSSGFVPIQSIIARAGGIPGKRDDIFARAKRPAAQMIVQDDGTIITTPRQCSNRVKCMKAIFVTITRFRTVVAPAETVTASGPTTLITVTSTVMENATAVGADATQMITEMTVATIPSTTTVVDSATVNSTTTSMIYSTFPTPYYAACAPDNIARSIDGTPIGRMSVKNTFGILSANTPYECCVRGIQDNYAGTFFQKGACFLISQAVPDMCDAEEQAFTFTTNAQLDMGDAIVLSNGNCGQGQYVAPPPRPQ